MHCARVKSGSLEGVYSRVPAWRRHWAKSAWAAGIVLLAALVWAGLVAAR